MLKKAKVVNISFENKIKIKANTRPSQFQEGLNQRPDINLQNFMKCKESTQLIYELLNIINGSLFSWNDLLKQNEKQDLLASNLSQNLHSQEQQLKTIFPKQSIQNSLKTSNKSISEQVSKTNTIFIPTDQEDQTNQDIFCEERKTIPLIQPSHFNPLKKFINKKQQNDNLSQQEQFFLIPVKYQHNLRFILTHFLNYKVFNQGKQNPFDSSNIYKRPQTTSKNKQNFKIKQNFAIAEFKPVTAISQSRTMICKAINQPLNMTTDFNDHLEDMMQIQKELERKSKRIIFLQNQLAAYSNALKDKNQEIKQLQEKDITMKKKFKYQIDRIMKGKIMTDINEIFVSSFNQSNGYGKSIFQMNGKKYMKSNEANSWTQNDFLTAPKSNIFEQEHYSDNKSKANKFKIKGSDTLKKSQSMVLTKKSKISNKKLQIQKQQKLLETINKELLQLNIEKQTILDRLSENNSKIQKHLQKIQLKISCKKSQIQRYTQQLEKLKDFSQLGE